MDSFGDSPYGHRNSRNILAMYRSCRHGNGSTKIIEWELTVRRRPTVSLEIYFNNQFGCVLDQKGNLQ